MGRKRIKSLEEMLSLGHRLGERLPPNTLLALSGDLGAGKTSFVQGLAQGLGIQEPVTSPTFVYLNIYSSGRLPLYHFDLYRLKSQTDFEGLGFTDYLQADGICAIEWPERIHLPSSALHLHFFHESLEERSLLVTTPQELLYLFA